MLGMINRFKMNSDVFGYWIVSSKGKIVYKDVPGVFLDEDLFESSLHILNLLDYSYCNGKNVEWIRFSFSLYKLLVMRLKLGMIVLLCKRETNTSKLIDELTLFANDAERLLMAASIQESVSKEIENRQVRPEYFLVIEKNLAEEVGPVSRLLIDEKIREMGFDRDNFPHIKILELLERICREKESIVKRQEFKRDMMLAYRLLHNDKVSE